MQNKSRYILKFFEFGLCLFLSQVSSQVFAREILPSPKSVLDEVGIERLQIKPSKSYAKSDLKVRIGIKIAHFRKQRLSAESHRQGELEKEYIHGSSESYVLSASLNKQEDFYVGPWHIIHQPTNFDQTSNAYRSKIVFFRKYGEFGQLEESIAELELNGELKKDDKGIAFIGTSSTRVRNKLLEPIFDITVGFNQPNAKETSSPLVRLK